MKKTKSILVFFRNDDVRSSLDEALLQITNLFIKYRIPITHAVEPGNISYKVVKWLKEIKNVYPDLIEIIQHGYDHSCKNYVRKGEFGGQRNYEEQYEDINKGKELMDLYFGDLWFPAFCFPNGSYNIKAMKAVADNGFKVVNGGWEVNIKHKIFYSIAHALNKEIFIGYRVPYNLCYRPDNKVFQINVNISLIDKYIDEDTCSIMPPIEKLKKETQRFMKEETIGILLHHRYHNTREKLKIVDEFLQWIKSIPHFQFTTIEKIYKSYAAKE